MTDVSSVDRASPDQQTTMGERIATLEAKVEQENTWVKRWSGFISLIALCITVVTGSYTIWEKSVSDPADERQKQIERVAGIIGRLGEINSELTRIQFSNNLSHLTAAAKISNIEKLSLLEEADSIINSLDHQFGFYVYFLLAAEHLSQGQNNSAVDYTDRAMAAASSPMMKAEARRGQAEALFSPGETQDIDLARQRFEEAWTHATDDRTFAGLASRVNVLRSFTIAEVFFGDCARARATFDRMIGDQTLQSSLAMEVTNAADIIKRQAGFQTGCRYPPHW